MTGFAHRLIGCWWGHDFCPAKPGPDAAPEDRQPCWERASKRIAVHADADDIEGTVLQFCPRHASLVMEETDERTGPVST